MRRVLVVALALTACNKPKQQPAPPAVAAKPKPAAPTVPPPAPGTAQVYGRVTFDGNPAPGLDIELCAQGCNRIFRAKTDTDGRYTLRDLPPGPFGLLQVRRFDSDVFQIVWRGDRRTDLLAGASSPADVVMTKTDVNITYPRPGARVSTTPTLRWAAYPGAGEYSISVHPGLGALTSVRPVLLRSKTPSATLDEPLAPGRWTMGLSAYSAAHPGQLLADAPTQVNFIVKGPNDKEPVDETVGADTLPPRGRIPTISEASPPAGQAALQGVVMYGDKPASHVEMKLCESFNQFTGCGGKSHKTTTDENGIYVFNVPPAVYGGLAARVFNTRDIIYAGVSSYGITTPTAYTLVAGQTVRAMVIHLYRADLRVSAPVGKAKSAQPEIRWAAYPGAASYTLTVRKEKELDPTKMFPIHRYRVAANRFVPDIALEPGKYVVEVTAWDAGFERLADTGRKPPSFTVGN
jgi:hypothetical protein